MNVHFFQRYSLKARVTLFTLVVFVLSIWSLAFYLSQMLRRDTQCMVEEQLFTTVSVLAKGINDELGERIDALEMIARDIDASLVGNPATLQSLLEQRPILKLLFNAGVFVTDPSGTAVASVPVPAGRVGVNYLERDHVAAAIKQGRAKVSEPAMGKMLNAPVVSIATPIRDAQGKVIGALVGVTDLSKPNFLERGTQNRYGKTGGYILAAPQSRLFVTATDKTRVMTPFPAPGVNPLFDRYVAGFEGSGSVVDARGLAVLSAAKRVPVADWILVARIPSEEAFAPIQDMEHRMLLATMFLTLLTGGLTWWMLRRQLAPMLEAAANLANLANTDLAPKPLPITSQDEIGELIGGFNALLQTLAKREEALKESERLLRESQSIAGLGSYTLDIWTGTWTSSAVLDSLFGIDASYVRSIQGWEALIHPDDRAPTSQYFVDEVLGQGKMFDRVYRIVRHDDQVPRWVHGLGRLELDTSANPVRLHGTIQDITDRKNAQDALRDAAQYTRSLIEASLDPLVMIDVVGRITDVNSATEHLTGMSRADLIGIDAATAVTDQEKALLGLQQALAQGSVKDYELAVRHVSGRVTDVLLNGSVRRDGNGNVVGVLVTARDITLRRQAEDKLRQLSIAVEQSPASVLITDLDASIEYVNPRFTEVTGYSAAEVIGKNPRILKSDQTTQETYREMWGKLTSGLPWHGELVNKRKNGELFWQDTQIAPVKNPAGAVTHYVAVKTDITERKRLEEQVQEMAFHDALTKLPNRRLLIDRLGQTMVISKRSGRHGALMFLDLDNFKLLNDTHGHGAGDLLLIEVARRLTSCVREIDTVARTGGDEFVVLLGHLFADEATSTLRAGAIAEKIRNKLAQPYLLPILQDGQPVGMIEHHCTASIGVVVFIDHQSNQEDLLKWADVAMYEAKHAGRNTVRFWN